MRRAQEKIAYRVLELLEAACAMTIQLGERGKKLDNKIDEINIDTTNIDIKLDIINSKCIEISNDLKRVLGLVHENIFIDLPNYDSDNNLISARLRIYSSEIDVGSNNNIIGTYLIESDSSGPGKFTNWKQVKI